MDKDKFINIDQTISLGDISMSCSEYFSSYYCKKIKCVDYAICSNKYNFSYGQEKYVDFSDA